MRSGRNTSYSVSFNERAAQQFLMLDPVIRDRLDSFLATGVGRNPRRVGKALDGPLKGFWRYKIGEYRILCRIDDERLLVLVVAVGHRKTIYRDKPGL